MSLGWGGAREGAGRKPAGYEKSEDEVSYDREKALHEQVKREQREFKLAVEKGEYLLQSAVSQASATAIALLAQSLRSIPANLERTCNLTAEQVEAAEQQIDTALAEVAKAFKALSGDQ